MKGQLRRVKKKCSEKYRKEEQKVKTQTPFHAFSGDEEENVETKIKRRTESRSPAQHPWTIWSLHTTRMEHTGGYSETLHPQYIYLLNNHLLLPPRRQARIMP